MALWYLKSEIFWHEILIIVKELHKPQVKSVFYLLCFTVMDISNICIVHAVNFFKRGKISVVTKAFQSVKVCGMDNLLMPLTSSFLLVSVSAPFQTESGLHLYQIGSCRSDGLFLPRLGSKRHCFHLSLSWFISSEGNEMSRHKAHSSSLWKSSHGKELSASCQQPALTCQGFEWTSSEADSSPR